MRANEQMDERVAQYLRLDSCLFQTIVHSQPHAFLTTVERLQVGLIGRIVHMLNTPDLFWQNPFFFSSSSRVQVMNGVPTKSFVFCTTLQPTITLSLPWNYERDVSLSERERERARERERERDRQTDRQTDRKTERERCRIRQNDR